MKLPVPLMYFFFHFIEHYLADLILLDNLKYVEYEVKCIVVIKHVCIYEYAPYVHLSNYTKSASLYHEVFYSKTILSNIWI